MEWDSSHEYIAIRNEISSIFHHCHASFSLLVEKLSGERCNSAGQAIGRATLCFRPEVLIFFSSNNHFLECTMASLKGPGEVQIYDGRLPDFPRPPTLQLLSRKLIIHHIARL